MGLNTLKCNQMTPLCFKGLSHWIFAPVSWLAVKVVPEMIHNVSSWDIKLYYTYTCAIMFMLNCSMSSSLQIANWIGIYLNITLVCQKYIESLMSGMSLASQKEVNLCIYQASYLYYLYIYIYIYIYYLI